MYWPTAENDHPRTILTPKKKKTEGLFTTREINASTRYASEVLLQARSYKLNPDAKLNEYVVGSGFKPQVDPEVDLDAVLKAQRSDPAAVKRAALEAINKLKGFNVEEIATHGRPQDYVEQATAIAKEVMVYAAVVQLNPNDFLPKIKEIAQAFAARGQNIAKAATELQNALAIRRREAMSALDNVIRGAVFQGSEAAGGIPVSSFDSYVNDWRAARDDNFALPGDPPSDQWVPGDTSFGTLKTMLETPIQTKEDLRNVFEAVKRAVRELDTDDPHQFNAYIGKLAPNLPSLEFRITDYVTEEARGDRDKLVAGVGSLNQSVAALLADARKE